MFELCTIENEEKIFKKTFNLRLSALRPLLPTLRIHLEQLN